MLKTTKRIATKTADGIQSEINAKFNYNVSHGIVINYKPFYVLNATDREKQSCLRKFCLNIRLRFVQYEKLLKNSSISKLFAFYDNRCELDQNGYYQLKCITETCVNCTFVKPFAKEDFAECGDISFHQFIVETYPIKNKAGETTRNNDGK